MEPLPTSSSVAAVAATDPQIAYFTAEQREFRTLLREIAQVLHCVSRKACERGIAALLPIAQEAIEASTRTPPDGLEEARGMKVVEILRSRPASAGPGTETNEPPKEASNPPKKTRGKATYNYKYGGGDDNDASNATSTPRYRFKPGRGMVPVSEANDKGKEEQNDDDDLPPTEDSDDTKKRKREAMNNQDIVPTWNASKYGNMYCVERIGYDPRDGKTLGLFILARTNGSGYKIPLPFFATFDELTKVGNMGHDKRRRVSNLLTNDLVKLINKTDEKSAFLPELYRRLGGFDWGKRVLDIIGE